jgi:Tfp pilus assembly protein PilN
VIRINLIPPEILQARKDEQLWKWVWLFGGVAALLVAMFWSFMFLQVATTTTEVASLQQDAQNLQAQTSRFAIFQQKEADLSARKSAVTAALAGRVDWARLLNEMGLVLPTDVYLTTFTGSDGGAASDSIVTIAGEAIDEPDDSPDNGYKSVAKMLVRLTELEQLEAVWLSSTSVPAIVDGATEAPMITWAVSARITPSVTPTASAN